MQRLADEIVELTRHLEAENRDPVDRLRDALNLESPVEKFQRVQALVMRVSDGFMRRGWPPLRVQASYFSQNGPKSPFEVNRLRTDLLASTKIGSSRTPTSHGPGFRLVIGGDSPSVRMQSRHSVEARSVFIKNVLSPTSSLWIDRCLGGLRGGRVVVRWTDEWFRIRNLEELDELALFVTKSKAFDSAKYSYFMAWKGLKPTDFEDENRLSKVVINFFVKTAPLFWAHHMMLEPKAARTTRQTKGQPSREQLRRDVLKLERRCQNADCPLEGGDPRKLKVAHLTPKVNLLSNVIVLCSLCYDEQFPATSVIRIKAEEPSIEPARRRYLSEIQTRDGPKSWRLESHPEHPLSNPRQA